MKQIEKILFFFLDLLKEWCDNGQTGNVSLVLHFQNGVLKQSFVDHHVSVPKDLP